MDKHTEGMPDNILEYVYILGVQSTWNSRKAKANDKKLNELIKKYGKLFQTAPKLLEALKIVKALINDDLKLAIKDCGKAGIYLSIKEINQIEQAIKKAEGN